MKKFYSLMLIFSLIFTTISPALPSVSADTEEKVYADGEYVLPFVVWQADKDDTSVADGYLEKPAKLIVEDGKYTVQTTLKNDSWWQYFKVESAGTFVDVTEISKDEDADTRVVAFEVEDLDEILQAKVHIIVTGIPGFNYDNKYDIRFNFDPSGIPFAPEEDLGENEEPTEDPTETEKPGETEKPDESENPGDPEEPGEIEEPEQPNQPEVLDIVDGDYTIDVEALHAEEDKASGMARYIDKAAYLSVKDGKTLLTLTLTDHKTVTGFQVEKAGKLIQPKDEKVNEENNTREVTYELDELLSIVNARVQYTVGTHNGDQPLRLAFNKDSLLEKEVEEPIKPEEPTQPEQSNALEIADGNYTIELAALHAEEDKASGMARYIADIASLSVKDDKTLLTLTLTDHKTVTGFQVESDGKLIEPKDENVNEEENTRTVTYELDELLSTIKAQVQYTVGAHSGDQPLRLSFNKESLQEKEEPSNTEKPEVLDIADGDYTIDFEALHAEEDKASGMAKYLDNPASLTVENGKAIVTLTINDHKTVTGFQVEKDGKLIEPNKEKVHELTNKREVTYELDTLLTIVKAQVQYTVGAHNGDQPLRLAFDQDSLIEKVIEEQPGETEKPDVKYKDGEYTLPFEVWQANKDETSVADSYLEKPAKLIVKDGKYTVETTLINSSWWQYFKVATKDGFVDVSEVSKDVAEDTSVVEFTVEDIDEILDAKVHIIVTGIPGFEYDNKYEIRFNFDTSNIPLKEDKEDPVDPEEPGEDRPSDQIVKPGETFVANTHAQIHVENSGIVIMTPTDLPGGTKMKIDVLDKDSSIKDGFKIAGSIVDVTLDFPEGMEDYAGKYTLTLPYDKDNYDKDDVDIYYFNEKASIWEAQNGTVNQTEGTISLQVDHFSKYAVLAEVADPVAPEEPVNPEKPDEGNGSDLEGKYQNGEYDLPFVVWQANKDEISVADGYLEKPAKLIVKDGTYTVRTTLKNNSWWQYFKVESNGKFIDVKEVSNDSGADTSVVEFDVENIDEMVHAKVHVIVTGIPGLEYDNKYDIRFNFDTSDIPLANDSDGNSDNHENNNGSNGNSGNNDNNGNNGNNDSDQKICKDGEYNLPFDVLQADKNEISVADQYLQKPAKLMVKDSKFVVEATLKNSSWWQDFKVASKDGFVDVKEISKNETEDTRVVQFNIQNPNEVLYAKVHIIVTGIPGLDYDNKYDIRFTFDTSGLPIDDCEVDSNGNGIGDGDNNENDPKEPKTPTADNGDGLGFDRNDGTGGNDNNKDKTDGTNPKTADKAKIILFASLLICSLIPLMIKLRSKFRMVS